MKGYRIYSTDNITWTIRSVVFLTFENTSIYVSYLFNSQMIFSFNECCSFTCLSYLLRSPTRNCVCPPNNSNSQNLYFREWTLYNKIHSYWLIDWLIEWLINWLLYTQYKKKRKFFRVRFSHLPDTNLYIFVICASRKRITMI